MVQLEEAIGELGRRIGHGGAESAAKVVRNLAQRLSQSPDPDAQAARFRRTLQEQAATLPAAPTKARVNALVAACLGCHQLHGTKASLRRIEALQIR